MNKDQLNIQRASSVDLPRFPAWLNFAAVSCAILLLVGLSFWTVTASRASLQENASSKLGTILEIESEAVRQWIAAQKQLAEFVASDYELAEAMSNVDSARPLRKLRDLSGKLNSKTCLLMKVDGTVVVNTGDRWLSDQVANLESQFCETLMSGSVTVSPVFSHTVDDGRDEFAFVVAAPIVGVGGENVGFLGIGHNLTDALTEVLRSSRSGKSGETIATTEDGRLVSRSRFRDDEEFAYSIDPTHSTKIDLSGSTDHRGVRSVIASKWLPEHGLNLITKMDYSEANAPVNRVLFFVWTLFSFVLLTAFSTLFYRWYLMRVRQMARRTELAKKRLGAYELEEKIGEGAMGLVYRARHALLRRPTAVKILPPERSNSESIQRFEQEVQFTSQLKHPNTISIYDYGRTEAGLFYYAMELLDGMSLDQLVEMEGPLPDGRVIDVMKQACRSLTEAHSLGLIHRDVKPANIMLCNRGGAFDTVKVLDFGMVRDQTNSDPRLDASLSGTPTYMAPECFTDPDQIDARVDIFALGAVAFFVLTGEPLFRVNSFDELLDLHIKGANVLARERFEKAISEKELLISDELVALVCDCLGRIGDRPSTVEEVVDRLGQCNSKIHWGRGSAQKWWASPSSRRGAMKQDLTNVPSEVNASLDETQAFESNQISYQHLEKLKNA